tara:strand:- start:282 stop:707 length:426 start_codon:yes stop_codon:yes gene_type:complete
MVLKTLEERAEETRDELIRELTRVTTRVYDPGNDSSLKDEFLRDAESLVEAYDARLDGIDLDSRSSVDEIRESAEEIMRKEGEVGAYALQETGLFPNKSIRGLGKSLLALSKEHDWVNAGVKNYPREEGKQRSCNIYREAE